MDVLKGRFKLSRARFAAYLEWLASLQADGHKPATMFMNVNVEEWLTRTSMMCLPLAMSCW